MFDKSSASDTYFLETEMGIVTRSGDWFHTTRDHIESFAPGLLDEVSLETLIKSAQAWVESADSLALILLYGLLFVINPWIAAVLTLIFHWLWYQYKSGFVVRGADKVLQWINSDAFLFLIAFVGLTFLGFRQQYAAVGIGIVFFFVLKPGLLRKAWDKITDTTEENMTLNDRVLKMVIVKWAMYKHVTPSGIQQMEDRLRELAFNHKKKDK